ncbi:MAG TPA: DNA polymerase Y family protein, partial [Burkholderiaceae bacterium]|nr:DNA polymerase Y family protein [Burkholderiaceae bacterium]
AFINKPRPAWLLDVPRRLTVRGDSPYYEGPLTLVAGPERIETGWWEGRERMAVRDYFIAETNDARLMWVYRERAQGGQGEAWYLHGKFA